MVQKSKIPYIDLYNVEKLIFNSVFSIIMAYALTIGYYKDNLVLREVNVCAVIILYVLIAILFLSWFFSHLNKSSLIYEGENTWNFLKGNKKYCFEISNISSIKKSFWGLYSSVMIVIDNHKIHIPTESKNLAQLIQNLSHRLTKEQTSDFLLYCQRMSCVCLEMEKTTNPLKYFCFFIAPLAFFIAAKIWEFNPITVSIVWSVLSILYFLLWTLANYFLLRVFVKYPAVFSRISAIWGFLGVMLYMLLGILYRSLYMKMIYEV